MLQKVILIVSTDKDCNTLTLNDILQSDVIDYEIEELTKEERECYD